MNPFPWIVSTGLPCVLTQGIAFRFLSRILVRKFSAPFTLAAMVLFDILIGIVNVSFQIANTVMQNTLYFCFLETCLYMALFHGSVIKKLFLAALGWCSFHSAYFILFPLYRTRFLDSAGWTLLMYIAIFLQGILLESIGRRLQNLRFGLPSAYTAYLLFILLFVFFSTVIATEFSLYVTNGELTASALLFCSLFSIAGMLAIVLSVFSLDRQVALHLTEQRYALQTAHFKSKEADLAQAARLRHDLKNHLLCLENLLQEGKHSQALSYLETLTRLAASSGSRFETGNDFADSILDAKYGEAASLGISFSADMILPDKSNLDPVDLCCILSNALDNAIEACMRLQGPDSQDKWIEARSFIRQSHLILEIRNSCPAAPSRRFLYSPKGPGHGLGLESIRIALGRYNGAMELSASDGRFTFSAMLPLSCPFTAPESPSAQKR